MAARKHGKRKAGHIGFQANEIAFIEDEMAALAAEYGLQVDAAVAKSVDQRKSAKKKARLRRQPQPAVQIGSKYGPTAGKVVETGGPRVKLVALINKRVLNTADFETDHGMVARVLRDLLPEGIALSKCAVPGCNCGHGGRDYVLSTNGDEDALETRFESDIVQLSACKKCRHGTLQHTLIETDAFNKPSGGQRLFGALYELIRIGRLAGATFRSRVWVTAIEKLLTSVLMHLKKQFTAGGTQNGQKTLTELQQEQYILTELQTLLKKLETASQKAISRDEMPVEMACVFDQMYFHCYYASVVLYGRSCPAVPAPDAYFSDLETFSPHVNAQVEAFLQQELVDDDGKLMTSLVNTLALPLADGSKRSKTASNSEDLALLTIYHARLREGIRLFYEPSLGMHGEMDALLTNARGVLTGTTAVKATKKPVKKHFRRERDAEAKKETVTTTKTSLVEMPAYELLTQWRNNCRDWCCHLYAYATPTPEALSVMAKYAPIVEVGAGTGYWSSLLQERGVEVQAFDVCPPSVTAAGEEENEGKNAFFPKDRKKKAKTQQRNAYHGHVPTFCPVAQGGPEVLRREDVVQSSKSLFLCYPPPHDPMAREALRCFQGMYVIHVGEWQGDTAERSFERALEKKFELVEELELPNWGNSAYSLTVWQRRAKNKPSAPSIVARLSCYHCHASLNDAVLDEDEPFKRCVLCKTHVYCSSSCEEENRRAHAAEHATRLVFLERDDKLEFLNDLHYKPLEAMRDEDDEEESSDEEDDTARVVVSKTNWKTLTTDKPQEEKKTETSSGHTFGFQF
ncbi:hypothetical protein Poli38472_012723 [Pythium oligandrum]|uniref:MYND-type domain-containing protein n=1 Tax=Pythium oligandrum TaxID=41045 RepID=A0A8K1FJ87_PYTOL|nr:hypothetical protein Poli38472_012723 [Pythium oligandrum]|eukprot:TMW61532.1 hypothetical protein Poli38472_012723 [Pythium oligandrum]